MEVARSTAGGAILPGDKLQDFIDLRRSGSARGPFAAQQILEAQTSKGSLATAAPDGFDDNGV
jgi:hypothetical protein